MAVGEIIEVDEEGTENEVAPSVKDTYSEQLDFYDVFMDENLANSSKNREDTEGFDPEVTLGNCDAKQNPTRLLIQMKKRDLDGQEQYIEEPTFDPDQTAFVDDSLCEIIADVNFNRP